MFIFVEARREVVDAFVGQFAREGVVLAGFGGADFLDWLDGATKSELAAIEGVLVGEALDRGGLIRTIRARCPAAVLALNDFSSLDQTLDLFACGVDDVVRKPMHVREILARVRAICSRVRAPAGHMSVGPMRVYFDGRDPEVGGDSLPLPRRERRILEFLAQHRGRRVTKSQIFQSIYGLFDDEVEENVVESHVSKLRKKLRSRIGYDPIDSKRFLGYCLVDKGQPQVETEILVSLRESAAGLYA
ncbi:MAG: response regulator transcription factor [Hyphomicrobiales bacterium]|nr:response regulator transcription factor [Hyphomicrobiales bacterium]